MVKYIFILSILVSCTTAVVKLKSSKSVLPKAFYGDEIGSLEFQSKKNLMYITHRNQLFQKIKLQTVGFEVFELIDWNFDGYKDLSILKEIASGGTVYEIWNFNKEKKQFVYNEEISNNFIKVDTFQKQIIFYYRGGSGIESWSYYKYKNDKLVFDSEKVLESWIDQNTNVWKKTTISKKVGDKVIQEIDSVMI
ncbi:MAG: hypothetical protein HYR91_10225 [Flavobacteriia bacterium]|nr:hypothetical protein [Flavobacteriia bacterium]